MNSNQLANQLAGIEATKKDYESKLSTAQTQLADVRAKMKELNSFIDKVSASQSDIDDLKPKFDRIGSYLEHVILQGKPFDEGEFAKKGESLKSSSGYLESLLRVAHLEYGKLEAREKQLLSDISTYNAGIRNCETQYENTKGSYDQALQAEKDAATRAAQEAAAAQNQSSSNNQPSPQRDFVPNHGGGSACFKKGTKVLCENGLIDIDKIESGMMVLTYNEEKNKNEYKEVIKPLIHENVDEDIYTLEFDNYRLEVTANHRFYVDKKWIGAKELKVNDKVMYNDFSLNKITNITKVSERGTYYNLEVMDNHNYYVSDKCVLVHNAKYSTTRLE